MTTSCTDRQHPYFSEVTKLENPIKFFTGENSYRMKYVSLGEALDFVSFGGMNFVAWEFGKKDMIKFIHTWMQNQKPRIKYKKVQLSEHSYRHEEVSREYYYLWDRFQHDFDEKLPLINYPHCPVNASHKSTVQDRGGRTRCTHIDVKRLKPSFIHEYPSGGRIEYLNEPPTPSHEPDEDLDDLDEKEKGILLNNEEWQGYLLKQSQFDEEATEEVINPCYAIISESKKINLPLESILYRLGVTNSFSGDRNFCAYPFSGFTLANYVKTWWNQEGRKRFYLPRGETENFRAFPDFVPYTSND